MGIGSPVPVCQVSLLLIRCAARLCVCSDHMRLLSGDDTCFLIHFFCEFPPFLVWLVGKFPEDNPGVQNPTFHPNGPTDVAVFHHYSVKSVEEYTWKVCVRGDVFDNSGCGVGNFSLSNFSPGYIHDDTAWKILKQSVSQYHRWSKDIDGK